MKATTTKKQAEAISKAALEQTRAPQELIPVELENPIAVATKQVVSLMSTALSNPKLDVRKMREIMDMQMDAMRFQSEISFNRAMVACQALIPHIKANCENKHTKSKYANLEAIDTVVRPIISAHGFSLNFNTEQVDARHVRVICTVRHIDGHKEPFAMVGELDDGGMKGTPNKTGIQAAGSSTSYLVRYLIKLIFHVIIIGEDNDGNKNGQGKPKSDAFADAAADERRGNQPQGEPANFEGGFAIEAGEKSKRFKSLTSAVKYLKEILGTIEVKQKRIDCLLDNKHILGELEKIAEKGKIAELHAIANGGTNAQ